MWKSGASNGGYHYLGCAKTMAQIGNAPVYGLFGFDVKTDKGWAINGSPEGEVTSIYDAAQKYAESNTPLIVVGGGDYGMGSSRDWAAKGTRLLGVKAVVTKSFEPRRSQNAPRNRCRRALPRPRRGAARPRRARRRRPGAVAPGHRRRRRRRRPSPAPPRARPWTPPKSSWRSSGRRRIRTRRATDTAPSHRLSACC